MKFRENKTLPQISQFTVPELCLLIQGINAILPYLTSRKIEVTKDDLVLMMQEKTVALDKLSEETKTVVEALGMLVILCLTISAALREN